MKPALITLAVAALVVAAAFYFRYSYTTTATNGTLPVVYVVRVDHWTGQTSIAWMMGNNCNPTWQTVAKN